MGARRLSRGRPRRRGLDRRCLRDRDVTIRVVEAVSLGARSEGPRRRALDTANHRAVVAVVVEDALALRGLMVVAEVVVRHQRTQDTEDEGHGVQNLRTDEGQERPLLHPHILDDLQGPEQVQRLCRIIIKG